MKKIIDYRKLLGVEKTTELKELKTVYRNLMKEWHPDKFQDSDERKRVAEEKSKAYIEAYNFLVSIAPETIESNLEGYTKTITTANVIDYEYKGKVLKIDFSDGSSYEYFGVPQNLFQKLVNSDIPGRFIRRNICNEFLYRRLSDAVKE
jgi:hypothetical protein